jgi:NAD(P)H-flavin reductase/ferredoxin
MVTITFNGTAYSCENGETVLDTLLRHKADIPYSCGKGTCLTCLVKATGGDVPQDARKNIRPSLAGQGYFLACMCRPREPLTIAAADDAALYGRAVVTRIEKVTTDVCRMWLRPSTPLYYRAGQFINIRREDGLVRSYSLASVPRLDRELEVHVKRMARGQMSNWIFDHLTPGDGLDLQGPNGNCFYGPGTPDRNLLLIGTGTGLAPLLGVVRDALDAGHTGAIHLYHGSREAAGLYLADDVGAMAGAHDNFHFVPYVSGAFGAGSLRAGRADEAAFADHADLSGWSVFICGYPAMVNGARKSALLAGATIPNIHADPFDFRDLRAEPRAEPAEKPDLW